MSILLAILAAVTGTVQYDCAAEQQVGLISKGKSWSSSADKLDRESRDSFKWRFLVTSYDDGSRKAKHEAGVLDALGVAGEYDVVPLAEGQIAFTTRKDRNCIYTEQGCAALVEISDIDAGNAVFSLTPAGSLNDQGRRGVMQIIMLGTCKRQEIAK